MVVKSLGGLISDKEGLRQLLEHNCWESVEKAWVSQGYPKEKVKSDALK
ncbi:Uncharacterized protein NEOC65_000183 [Neochlamydia sp. AcF65]|nr:MULTISPECIES: hypothetical protein [unclassified Neochlamydia]MBS4165136.1 Uncharacterized protein [Neochlamydia sp. AcF65]